MTTGFEYYASQDNASPRLPAQPLRCKGGPIQQPDATGMAQQVAHMLGSSQGLGVFALHDDLEGIEWIPSNQQQAPATGSVACTAPESTHGNIVQPPAGVFYTASNKPVVAAVSDTSRQRAEQILGDVLNDKPALPNSTGPCPSAAQATPLFSTASGRPVEINAAALRHAAALFGEDIGEVAVEVHNTPFAVHHAATSTAAAHVFDGFTTASGKRQAVSEKAMRHARALLGDVLDSAQDDQAHAPRVAQHTPARLVRDVTKRVAAASTGGRKRFRYAALMCFVCGCCQYTSPTTTRRSPLMETRAPNSMGPPNRTRFAVAINQPVTHRAPVQTRPRQIREAALSGSPVNGAAKHVALPTHEQLFALVGGEAGLVALRNALLQRGVDPVAANDAWVCHHARYGGSCSCGCCCSLLSSHAHGFTQNGGVAG